MTADRRRETVETDQDNLEALAFETGRTIVFHAALGYAELYTDRFRWIAPLPAVAS